MTGHAITGSHAIAASAIVDRVTAGRPDRALPRIALILGSGLGPLADELTDSVSIAYSDLLGFPAPGVSGHSGTVIVGDLGGVPVLCFQGRVHPYEGRADAMALPIRSARAMGCDTLYLTCAAGSLRPDLGPGSLMTITDHINMSGTNPLVGPNNEDFGPRFPPMENAYDGELIALQASAAASIGIPLAAGVYVQVLGPMFETPAEVRMLGRLGGDAVGMSTVPECIIARHCGLRVTATAVVTNLGVGLSASPVTHAQTLAAAEHAGKRLGALIKGVVAAL
jgi:xanthosine phosphorylase